MLRIRKILFPTDLSERAEQAFTQAAFLADRYAAELHVLNVVVPRSYDLHRLTGHDAEDDPGSESQFQWAVDLDEELAQGERVQLIHRQVQDSSAGAAIVAYADDHDIDLIVMATHGRVGVDRWVLGSTTEKVVRQSPCPVLTVHSSDLHTLEPDARRLLVPVDFSEHSTRAIRYAVELAKTYNAEVDLLHAYEEIAIPDVYGVGPVMLPAQTIEKRVQEALNRLAAEAEHTTVPIKTHVLVGYPALTILDFAERHESDLIVIATHGWSGLKRLLMGSVTEKVVRMAPCPVFTVRSFGKSLLTEEAEATSTDEG